MAQGKRQESSTGVYHVIAKGIARENNFSQIRERKYFQKIIRKYKDKYAVKIFYTHFTIIINIIVTGMFSRTGLRVNVLKRSPISGTVSGTSI